MTQIDYPLMPGQIRGVSLRCGSVIVAVDGPLMLSYRNESLNWLLQAAPMITVALDEGDAHGVPYATFIELHADRHAKSIARIEHEPHRLSRALDALLRVVTRLRPGQPRVSAR